MTVPDKCLNCSHAISQFENVHKGWCKYQMDYVVRCDCSPVRHKVGCVCAEIYCNKKRKAESEEA